MRIKEIDVGTCEKVNEDLAISTDCNVLYSCWVGKFVDSLRIGKAKFLGER